MAIYHFTARIIKRSEERSAIAAAAYRAAAALYDERTGRTHNYLDKPGVIHSEILLPAGAPSRWLDRATLWNETEARERQRNSQLARDIELAVPRELSQAAAIRLVQDFARQEFVARGMVADLNIHWGQAADGAAQPHAHIMLSMRRVVPGPEGRPEEAGFGLKEFAWNDWALLRSWRAAWAELVNARLTEAGIDLRVDHRSNAARGIELEPQNKIGPAGARRDVRGEQADRAEEHRAIARRNGERILAEPELALQALTRQQSTFTRHDLARLVHRHSDGAAQFDAVLATVEASPELVRVGEDGRGRVRFSTREMIAIERRMEAMALALSQRTTHAVTTGRRRALLAGSGLGAEQRLAFGHVTRSRDLAVVVGTAGTGKSAMLGVARQAWEAEGYTVRGAALSGIAAEGLEGGSGIASRTIASWEHAWAQGFETLGPRDVLVVDEAGMIGSRQMTRLLAAVDAAGAKLVLVGDHEQLQAIEAGAAFRAIVERVGAVEITAVQRQQAAWQREATRELATGRTEAALDRYAAAGMLHAHATDAAARTALIAGWQAARQWAPGDRQIILAHTREDVRRLNQQARALRRAAGELGADHLLPTELGARHVAIGDRIYFLRNERGLGVKNGTLGTITAIAGEGEGARLTVRLDGANRATGAAAVVAFSLAEYAQIDHGYAATVHKAQSVTVDRAHVLATPGMDRHLAYVALTRHRHGLALHWSEESFGSREGLAARLGRERAKDTTLDYGESEAELCAVYAERRGLSSLAPASPAPASEIVLGGTARPAADPAALVEELRTWAARHPGLALRNLRRAQLAHAMRPVLATLRTALDQHGAALAALGTALERFGQRGGPRPSVAGEGRSPLGVVLAGMRPRAAPADPQAAVATPMAERLAQFEARIAHEQSLRQLKPLLPAAPYQPVTEAEIAALVAAHLASLPQPDRLTPLLEKAYRDPTTARARLDTLLRERGDEAVAETLRRDGPALLGKLRGRTGMLASQPAMLERAAADAVASDIPEALLLPRRLRAELTQGYRSQLEADRQRDTIAVPGLSDAALAAIATLEQAGAERWVGIEDTPLNRLSAGEIARAGRVAAAWSAIHVDERLREELARFGEAASQRLNGRPEAIPGHPAAVRVSGMLDVLDGTAHLVSRHTAIEAAHVAERRKAERAEREAREKAAEREEMERQYQEFQRRRFGGPRSRPSHGPGMG